MAIALEKISILIPTYRYRDRVERAIRSALESGAGEVVVVDDHSRDGTVELAQGFNDPRLRVYENASNLGLWENHLKALTLAQGDWVKILQADDYLLPSGLSKIAAVADPTVSIVWSNPIFVDELNGRTYETYTLSEPRRLSPAQTLAMLKRHAWVLGTPSMMMWRRDAVVLDPAIWRREVSADLVAGTIAATRGDTVLVPAGTMVAVFHPEQDGHQQGFALSCRRAANSAAILRRRPEPELRDHGACLAAASFIIWSRAFIAQLRRGQSPTPDAWRAWLELGRSIGLSKALVVAWNLPKIARALHRAWFSKGQTSLRREGRPLAAPASLAPAGLGAA